MIVHANSVARFEGGWRAVLLFGPSGAGKSDLTLRLLTAGWRLVGDDYSRLWVSGGRLFAGAPEALRGRIEARGVGIVPAPGLPFAEVDLAVDCVEREPERLPYAGRLELDGAAVPRLPLRAFEASAVSKLSHALTLARGGLGADASSLYEAASGEAEPVQTDPLVTT